MRPALIVVDMQKAFFNGNCKVSMEMVSPVINDAITCFKNQNLPIIWVQDINEKEGAILGTEGFEIIDGLDQTGNTNYVHKQNLDCFTNTNCCDLLKNQDIDVVFIAGFCADYCVLSSYKGALKNGFIAAILKEGIAAGSQEAINHVIINYDTISISLLKKIVAL
ncbi:isochorismatase family cysteine hydrolase [uncultured Algibacter sp.]|uniref:cysteine hydrolase family protein n=1 Tax=uncultured Algibacter sp. TaxID=298659 RepID=UPI003217552E